MGVHLNCLSLCEIQALSSKWLQGSVISMFSLKRTSEVFLVTVSQIPVLHHVLCQPSQSSYRKVNNTSDGTNLKNIVQYSLFHVSSRESKLNLLIIFSYSSHLLYNFIENLQQIFVLRETVTDLCLSLHCRQNTGLITAINCNCTDQDIMNIHLPWTQLAVY